MGPKLKLLSAMALFGTLPLFVRVIPLGSAQLALCRVALGFALLLALQLFRGRLPRFSAIKKDAPRLFLSGALMGFNWVLLFKAYGCTTVSVATLSYYFAPVLVMALSPLLFHERTGARQIVCFVMSTVGLALVINPAGIRGAGDLRGIAFGLGAAVLYAAVVLLNKSIRSVSGVDRTLLQFAAALAVLLPYAALSEGLSFPPLDARAILSLLAVGAVHTGLCYCLYFVAVGSLSGQEAAILSYADPLVAVLVSVLVLREAVAPAQILGGALILGFTLLSELQIKKS